MISDILIGLAILVVIAAIFAVGFFTGYIIGQMSVSKEYFESCDQAELIELRKKVYEYEKENRNNTQLRRCM